MPGYRYGALATFLLLGACAHVPPPHRPTQERTPVIREPLDADTGELRALPQTVVAPAELTVPRGIDVARFELPVQYHQSVQEYVDRYAHHRRRVFITWLQRMGRYREHIEAQLHTAGLPRELVYLPLIESAYEINAASHASAVGLWQFMKGTARSEGLEVSAYVDERRDPVRSTEAALHHLQDLYQQFGSWYLAAAAYNSGSSRIARLLREHGYAEGGDRAFWAIRDRLPRETRDYVPMLLAAVIVGENTEHFGLSVQPEPTIRFEAVTVPGGTMLSAVAHAAGTTLEQIQTLNPHFIQGLTPPGRTSHVYVPPGAGERFVTALENVPKAERTGVVNSTHVVKAGETLSTIARKYGTTVEAISRINSLDRPDVIATGTKLVIPTGS